MKEKQTISISINAEMSEHEEGIISIDCEIDCSRQALEILCDDIDKKHSRLSNFFIALGTRLEYLKEVRHLKKKIHEALDIIKDNKEKD